MNFLKKICTSLSILSYLSLIIADYFRKHRMGMARHMTFLNKQIAEFIANAGTSITGFTAISLITSLIIGVLFIIKIRKKSLSPNNIHLLNIFFCFFPLIRYWVTYINSQKINLVNLLVMFLVSTIQLPYLIGKNKKIQKTSLL